MGQQQQFAKQVFVGNSEMARLMRSQDWSQTLLGSVADWSVSLKTAVNICLNSRFPMVIWWGRELVLLYNDAWRTILGNRHPKALSSPGEAIFSESWHIVGPQLNSVLETGIATWSEDLLIPVFRSGYLEEAYYTYSYSPIFTETGKVEGVFTAVAETTHRVLSERRLATLKDLAAQSSKAKTVNEVYQSTLKTLSNNPSDISFAALYQLHSDQMQATLCGQTPADLGAIPIPKTIHLSEADPWSFAAVLHTQTAVTTEDLAHQFGEVPAGVLSLPIHQALTLPIRASGQDTIVGLLVVGVNPACTLDPEYRTFFDLIAGHIATAIANARAYEAERKRAEALIEIDRAKTAFFSNVSHEFRTPLTLMLGPLEDMLSHSAGLDLGDREQLETVHRNSLRLLKLVNTLLDFSRIEADRIQAVYQPTDLARLTTDLAGMFRSATDRARLRLVVDCVPLSEPAYVDPEMWEKILLNLLSNAFKFTFEGEIAVVLRNPPGRIELEIRDTGTGIPADELPHIFERFHRVQGARGRTFEGSGIGLSLVQELVALHGGTIQVNSVVDRGTSFTISIPTGSAHLPSDRIGVGSTLPSTAMGATPYVEEILRWLPEKSREDAESRDSASSLDFYSQIRPFSGPKARILLADDNADMRNYLKRLLSQQYEVEAVTDGVAALAAVHQQRPDLVLTDVMMPGLDGFGILRELRADPQTQELPIILLSARAGEESRIEGLQAGADDYLIKPFSARELLARVEANLKLAQLRQEATQKEQAQRQEAETAKEQLETVLSSIRDQFVVLDREWCCTYVNRRVVETVGMPREDLLGRSIWELFPVLIDSEFERQVRWAIAEQTLIQFEYYYPTWNRWFEIHAYPSPEGITLLITEISDRKQAEAALHQSLAILNTINQSTPTLIFVKDRQGRLQMGNPALMHALGKSEAEVIGHTDAEFYRNPDDAEVIMANDRQVMETGQIQVWEETLELPEGRRTFLSTKSPYADERGEIVGLVGISFDITDRKHAEALLRASHDTFHQMVENSPFGIYVVDADFCLAQVSVGAQKVFENVRPLIGRDFAEVLRVVWPEPFASEAIALFRQTLQTGEPYHAPTTVERRYDIGTVEAYDWKLERIALPDGRFGVVCHFYDLSERQRYEAALRDREQRLTLATEAAQLGVFEWQVPEDVAIWENERLYEIYGHTRADGTVSSQDFFENYLHPDDTEAFTAQLTEAMQTGVLRQATCRVRRRDGTTIWLELNGQFEFAADGSPLRLVGVTADITDRKQAEIALQTQARELSQMNAQLVQTTALVNQRNQELDQFTHIVSHDLKAPLRAISNLSIWIEEDLADQVSPDTKQNLDLLRLRVSRMETLINGLLTYARVGYQDALDKHFALNDLLLEIVDSLAIPPEFTVEIPPNLPTLTTNRLLLNQVFTNLISNAVKHHHRPDGQVRITAQVKAQGYEFTVSDDGPGIDPKHHRRVFDIFQTLSSQENTESTGIGLAIIRKIVERIGGHIYLESELGQGTTFRFTWPL